MKKLASLEINNDIVFIEPVLDFLDSLISKHSNHDFGRYNRLRYVVGELLERRVRNAYPNGQGSIIVDLFLSEDFFEVSIKDKGIPVWDVFSYEDSFDIRDEKNLRNYLLDMWVDDIGMEKLGKEGQRIFVRMKVVNPIAFVAPEPYPEMDALDTNISIREVQSEEDVIEAIRCIYSEYGYSYGYERLYYVDTFMKMIQNGEIRSFLAVNDHGQTAGHFALSFSDIFKGVPEISTVVTRRQFRGLGLFAKFMDYCMNLGEECGYKGLMGQPVAFHPMSQKAFLRSGFTATSLLLAYINSEVESEYNKENKRMDLFSSIKILDREAYSRVYPPKELWGFVEKVYNKLGCRYDIETEDSVAEFTQFSMENNHPLKITKIRILEAGTDCEKILAKAVNDALRKKSEMLELFISLSNPSCSYAYESAKKKGFVLSGILPGGEADYLLMQMIVGEKIKYDHLIAVGDFEELTKDIIAINKKEGETDEF